MGPLEPEPPLKWLSKGLDLSIALALTVFSVLLLRGHPAARRSLDQAVERAFERIVPKPKHPAPGQRQPGTPPDHGKMADFFLPDAEGRLRSFTSLTADGRALLYLYSAGCGHCAGQLPEFSARARDLERAGLRVVGVQYMGSPRSLSEARSRYELPGQLLADPDGALCGRLGVGEFTVLLVEPGGRISYKGSWQGLPAGL